MPSTADEELAGAGADVADLFEDRLRRAVEQLALGVREERRGRLLDELLVATLQRAVARRDDDDVAFGIREALGLDVAGLVEVLLDEALAAAEGCDRFAGGRLEELGNLLAGAGDLETATAAAEGRLDGDRQPDLVDEREHLGGVGDRVQGSGGERRADLLGHMTGGHLVAETLDGIRGGPDPDEAGVDDGAREVGVLGEEAVAGVHRVGAGPAGDREQLLDDEVGLGARGAVERVRLVGQHDVPGVPILVGVDGDRGDPRVSGGADDTHRDLSPIGDQDLRDASHSDPSLGRREECAVVEEAQTRRPGLQPVHNDEGSAARIALRAALLTRLGVPEVRPLHIELDARGCAGTARSVRRRCAGRLRCAR